MPDIQNLGRGLGIVDLEWETSLDIGDRCGS